MFKPYSTLLVGIVIGAFVVPKVVRATGLNVPGV